MEDINVACQAFVKSVDDYIIVRRRKRRRRRQKRHDNDENDDDESTEINLLQRECNLLVEHANLVLYTLSAKRTSLSNAIQAFRAELTKFIERFVFYSSDSSTLARNISNNDNAAMMQQQVEVVRRWFANYVRLRDGFVLLESGERRHDHDDEDDSSKSSSSSSFPSKLKGALRPDGITRKFKSDKGYTGRGYDEVYDDDVGIKRRLLQTLAKLDCGRRSITTVDEKLFDDESGGATQWQMCMDEHISLSKGLREELNSIAHDFVLGINRHLLLLNSKKTSSSSSTKTTTIVKKLTLNTDDKFERIKLGDLIDISRRGNDFSIKDKGGSLPIGMSFSDWRVKFTLMKVHPMDTNKLSQKKIIDNVRTVKKRKVILEDSSEDSDDDNNVIAAAVVNVNVHSSSKVEMDSKAQDDGLMVRNRMATDVTSDNHQCTNHVNDGELHDHNITTSIDEMKRQLGVNSVELQRGHDQLEDEKLLSSMAANEEDIINGVLVQEPGGDMVNNKIITDSSNYSTLVPLLKQCYSTRNEVRKNMHNLEHLREMQDICSDFDDTAKCWNDHLQTLSKVRSKEIAKGLLTETSDRVSARFFLLCDIMIVHFTKHSVNIACGQAYNIRENCRESSMLLGIDSMEIYDFFSELQQEGQKTTNRVTTSNLPSSSTALDTSLFKACRSFLMFAQEIFKSALNLVLEHEKCQVANNLSLTTTIDNIWEKGQHLLLCGRAHYNIGLTMYELARDQRQGVSQVESNTSLMNKARDEFDNSVTRAKSIIHNAVLIRGHSNAREISSQSIYSWTSEAVRQHMEAIKLEVLASGSHIMCSCAMDDIKAAKERFTRVFESVEISGLMNFTSIEGITSRLVAEVICDMYCFAMRVAGLSTEHLERQGGDMNHGDNWFQFTLLALHSGTVTSNELFKLDDRQCFTHIQERGIADASSIQKEENEIIKWWESTKAQAHLKLSDVTRSGCVTYPRSDVAREVSGTSSIVAAPTMTRRIIVQSNGRLMPDRSTLCQTTRPLKTKDSSCDKDVGERFTSEFNPCNSRTVVGEVSASAIGKAPSNAVVYRKWGNEVLKENERKRCCPALPTNWAELGLV